MKLPAECQEILQDLAIHCPEDALTFVPCELARRWRPALTEKLFEEACKEGGEVMQVAGVQMDRGRYLRALQDLITWTHELCRMAAIEQGPAMVQTHAKRCGTTHKSHCPRKTPEGTFECETKCGRCTICIRNGCGQKTCVTRPAW